MKSIPTFEASPRGYAELYETVLVDTPVGPYFQRYLEQAAARVESASEVRNVLEEVQIEILKNSLMKLYLEDFYTFCEKMGGDTAEVMCALLRAKADRYAISITLNSFGTPLNDPTMRETDRKKLYPSIGELYPQGNVAHTHTNTTHSHTNTHTHKYTNTHTHTHTHTNTHTHTYTHIS